MKYLQSLSEALKDDLDPMVKKRVSKMWGKNVLNNDAAQKTNAIQLGKWELSEKDKSNILDTFFYGVKIDSIKEYFQSLPKELEKDILESLTNPNDKKAYAIFDINRPTLRQIKLMYTNSFRIIDSKSTLSDKIVLKDDTGKPILDANSKIQTVDKPYGEIVWTKNVSDFSVFLESWAKSRPERSNKIKEVFAPKINHNFIKSNVMSAMNSCLSDNDSILDFNIFNDDKMYLYITDHPTDTLNMSVSQFFNSCQNLYVNNSYNKALLMNVFDVNMVPAFLIFDTPYKNQNGKILNKFTPLSRTILRKVEGKHETDEIYFDRCYPDRMRSCMKDIIEKYTTNKDSYSGYKNYVLKHDVLKSYNLDHTYQDNLRYHAEPYFGKNVTILDDNDLRIDYSFGYSKKNLIKSISPDNKIEVIVIDKRNIDFWKEVLSENQQLFKNVKWLEVENIDRNDNILDFIWNNSLSIRSGNDIDIIISKLPNTIERLELLSCYSTNKECPNLPTSIKELSLNWSYLYLPGNINEMNNLETLIVSINMKKYNTDVIKSIENKINISYDEGL
jgi:hypothetical protein